MDERCLRGGWREVWSAAVVRRLIAIVTPILGLVFVTWAQTFWSAAAMVAVPACSNVDANGITPLTGIEILSNTLTAGRGCGTGPGEIYKYAAVVQIPPSTPDKDLANAFIAGGVYDCFATGTFANLCTYNGDAGAFDLKVYAFTAATWNGLSEDGGVSEAGAASGVVTSTLATLSGHSECSGASFDPTSALAPVLAAADWTTMCTATQQSDAPVTASCGPLQPAQP
jgi:hypothetical protein